MKKLPFLLFLILPILGFKAKRPDDTLFLISQLGANYTMPAGHAPWNISSTLIVTHNLNMNGNTIITSQTTGAAIKLNATGASVSNGTVQGSWDPSMAGNPSTGNSGIIINCANASVINVHILGVSAYGINCSNLASNLTVNNSKIEITGYIGFFFDPEANGVNGGTFTNNIIDRSMLPATTIQDACSDIRASRTIDADTTSGWTISGNTYKMPSNPSAPANECLEVRHMKNSTLSNNTCSGGTIGISVVRCNNITLTRNKFTGSRDCGLELADTQDSRTFYNSSNGSNTTGFLLDGGTVYCRRDTLNFDTIQNAAVSAIHCYTNTKKIVFNGGVYKTTTDAIDCQSTDSLTFNNTTIDGLSHTGTTGIFLDNGSPGNVKYNNGAILNCVRAVRSYNTALNYVVNNIIGSNVDLTGTSTQFYGVFTNGAHFGTNIRFNTLSFGTIASRVYGASDFDPGAVSGLGITYTSGNTAVATIVSGKIHIIGVGTSTITANNGDMILTQPAIISKAPLTITADNKSKAYGAVNPTLTAHYSTFQYGQDHTVLTTQPTLTTPAVTGSIAGTYTITASGATAANYSIVFVPGTLTINPPIIGGSTTPPVIRRHKAVIKKF